MKNQVNPAVFAVCIVVLLVVLVFVGLKIASPPAPSEGPRPTAAATRPTEINGHAVPNNVPADYMQKPVNQGSGGYQGSGAPGSMMGGAQHP